MATAEVESAKRRRRLVATIGFAILADYVLLALLDPARRSLPTPARVIGFVIAAAIAFLFGLYLGKRVWPRRGRKLALLLLRRAVRGKKDATLIFVTDRPDFDISMMRRIVDVVAFAAGSTIIFVYVTTVLEIHALVVFASSGLVLLIALWGSFAIVPYWVFGRMGLRQVDPVRWLVQPMSRRYADRLRLSNGALLIIAAGAAMNLAFRAGGSRDEAVLAGLSTVGDIVASVLMVAGTAVAFYEEKERAIARDIEQEAIAMGLRDARGVSDGDFLPRVVAKSK